MRLVSHARKNLSTDCAGLPILATDEVRKPSHFRLTVVSDTARLPPCAVAIESVPFAFGMNEWLKLGRARRGVSVRNWVRSDLGAFGQFQSVLHVNAQVAHRAVDLGMAEKDLNGAEVASRLVDDRRFRAP
jgi:hypothetical protein